MRNDVPQPPKDAPRHMVVAVRDLTDLRLMVNIPQGRYQKGDYRPLYGCTLDETGNFKSFYTNDGVMPPVFRTGNDEGEKELLFCDLPNHIDEVIIEECPGAFMVVLPEYDLVERPEPEAETECRVLQHPSVTQEAIDQVERIYFEKKVADLKKKAARCTDKRQLFLFPEIDSPQTQRTA